MEKDKKIVYLRFATIDSPKFVGKVLYTNYFIGVICFIIFTFFTDLPFTELLFYNHIMYAVLVIQFIVLMFFTLRNLYSYKVNKRYMKQKIIKHFKTKVKNNVFRKIFLVFSLLLWLLLFPFWIFYMYIYREYIKFGVVFFPYDSSLGRFAGDPVNTGNMVRSVKSVLITDLALNFLVVFYGFYLIIFLFCLIRGE